MNLIRYILTVVVILAFANANAKIATWSISPMFQDLQRYTGDLYLCQINGKWGVVKTGDEIVLPANYDFITPFVNGYSLVGSKEGGKYLLQNIVSEDGKVISITEKYYLPGSNQYFSEEKLVISDKTGKYGYINTSGDLVIKCQFDNALPFKEGYAPVKKGNYMKYIGENYDRNPSRNTLVVDFHYGEMTVAGCFSNGVAPVGYNNDFALINSSGQKIQKIKEAEFKQLYKKFNSPPDNQKIDFTSSSNYSKYEENGKWGLKQANWVIVTPQFDAFGQEYSDGDLIASMGGKQGVLRISEGEVAIRHDISGRQTTELEMNGSGKIHPITFVCNIPDELKDFQILINPGTGELVDKTSQFVKNGQSLRCNITPAVSSNSESVDTRLLIRHKGITLADQSQHFSVVYPIKLRISKPGPSTVRANEEDQAVVSSTIYNDSNKPVTVTASWSNGKSYSVTVPAHGSKTVSTTFYIPAKATKTVSIKLSSGESAHSTITFNTFF